MAREGESRQAAPGSSSLKETLDLARRHLVRETYGFDGEHIRAPFDALVEKRSITIDMLRSWSQLPIEMSGAHLPDGRFVISSGSPGNTGYDWSQEAKKDMVDELPFLKRTLMKIFPSMSPHVRASMTTQDRSWNEQEYSIHNHPERASFQSRVYRRIPSPSDLRNSRKSRSRIDVILSGSHILFYKAPPGLSDFDPNEYAHERPIEEAVEILRKGGVYLHEIPLDEKDPAFRHALAFLQGIAGWAETQKLLEQITPSSQPR
jgi:hypothetical protein